MARRYIPGVSKRSRLNAYGQWSDEERPDGDMLTMVAESILDDASAPPVPVLAAWHYLYGWKRDWLPSLLHDVTHLYARGSATPHA